MKVLKESTQNILTHWKSASAVIISMIVAIGTMGVGIGVLGLTSVSAGGIVVAGILAAAASLVIAFIYNLGYEVTRSFDSEKENKWTWKLFTVLALVTAALIATLLATWYVTPIIPFVTGIALFTSLTPAMVAVTCSIAAGAIAGMIGFLGVAAYEFTCWLDFKLINRDPPLAIKTETINTLQVRQLPNIEHAKVIRKYHQVNQSEKPKNRGCSLFTCCGFFSLKANGSDQKRPEIRIIPSQKL